jgi:hypothetical protein
LIPGSVFARYAHPPNVLGYCGPSDPNELITATSSERGSQGFAAVARRFAGVWPYLELIAVSNGISDPLEDRVVEAYWIGSTLLEGVPVSSLLDCVRANPDGRMSSRLGRSDLEGAVLAGGIANHNFHVFAVYPWLALARSGRLDPAMSVLERCCIRSGRVTRVDAGNVEVWTRPVALDGTDLVLGDERLEQVRCSADDLGFVADLVPGDLVSLHWDRVCDRLHQDSFANLQHYTARSLKAVNASVRRD